MKTTKKCAALFAAFVMALSLGLTACGDSDDDNGSGGGNTGGG